MRDLFLTTLRRAKKLARLIQRKEYRHGLKLRVAAAIEHEGAIRPLDINSLIDVGANIGQFSLMAHALHPTLHIHAFEPLPGAAERFKKLMQDRPNTTLHLNAAGEVAGNANIYVSKRVDSSSLLPITELQDRIFPGTAQSSVEKVRVVRIDDALEVSDLPKPIMIKLDVQGFELSALKGMPKLLRHAQYVYTEVSFKELYRGQPLAHEILVWLSEIGYQISGVYNTTEASDGTSIQADILFTKASDGLGMAHN